MVNFYEMSLLLEGRFLYTNDAEKIQKVLSSVFRDLSSLHHAHYHFDVLDSDTQKTLGDYEDVKNHGDRLRSYGIGGDTPEAHAMIEKDLLDTFGAEKLSRVRNFKPQALKYKGVPFANPPDFKNNSHKVIEYTNSELKQMNSGYSLEILKSEGFASQAIDFIINPSNVAGLLEKEDFDTLLDNIKQAEQDLIKYVKQNGGNLYSQIKDQRSH
jgi:hypothetical protein